MAKDLGFRFREVFVGCGGRQGLSSLCVRDQSFGDSEKRRVVSRRNVGVDRKAIGDLVDLIDGRQEFCGELLFFVSFRGVFRFIALDDLTSFVD